MRQVVAVLNGVGAILAIEEDVLGATVLAWGETLPDLVAMLAVARAGASRFLFLLLHPVHAAQGCGSGSYRWVPRPCAGQGTMAVAAIFGGPVLNLLIGTGVPVLGASFRHGILPFKLTHGVVALFLQTVGFVTGIRPHQTAKKDGEESAIAAPKARRPVWQADGVVVSMPGSCAWKRYALCCTAAVICSLML